MAQQPWLHHLEIAVDGPSTVLGAGDGDIGGEGQGWFLDDRRLLRTLTVRLDSTAAVPVAVDTTGNVSRFWGVARYLGDDAPDPTVELRRARTLDGETLTETLTLSSRAAEPVRAQLSIDLAADGTDISVVKMGRGQAEPLLAAVADAQLTGWRDERHEVAVDAAPAAQQVNADAEGLHLTWPVDLAPRETLTLTLTLRATRLTTSSFDSRSGARNCDFTGLHLRTTGAWAELVDGNLADLRRLLQTDPLAPQDVFAAAGSPWYLTLFGRDSLWAARFLAPFSPALAGGTLRTLARRQGTTTDADTACEPGKILHEVRRGAFDGHEMHLPPLYYGTVDATALWVCLLHDAWRWGLPQEQVGELLPAMEAALEWIERRCAASADGLLRYVDESGHGLTNQGWKDSGDSMRRADGTIAPAPIALVEAQGYAVEAALGAARILRVLRPEDGTDAAEHWEDFAAQLSTRIRETFWTQDASGPYLAMAVDGEGNLVDGVGSNMGHLLGTGALDEAETALVVERLMRPDMLRTFGIATLSADNPAFNPLGYHTGSVWTHDTAVVLRGLIAEGRRTEADLVLQALGRLSAAVRHRFPELLAGDALGTMPVPYPASCRPQAWSAASAAVIAAALVGVHAPSEPGQEPARLEPSALLGTGWSLSGLRVGERELTVEG